MTGRCEDVREGEMERGREGCGWEGEMVGKKRMRERERERERESHTDRQTDRRHRDVASS